MTYASEKWVELPVDSPIAHSDRADSVPSHSNVLPYMATEGGARLDEGTLYMKHTWHDNHSMSVLLTIIIITMVAKSDTIRLTDYS